MKGDEEQGVDHVPKESTSPRRRKTEEVNEEVSKETGLMTLMRQKGQWVFPLVHEAVRQQQNFHLHLVDWNIPPSIL